MSDQKTQKKDADPIPAVLVHGPAGSGKSALIDQMVKFFGTQTVNDDYVLPKDKNRGEGADCRWTNLKPGNLYITNEAFTPEDALHAGMGHGVFVASIWDVLKDLGDARGRTATELYTERAFAMMMKDLLGGPRRR